MARYVAFLRGMNVGGHVVKMDRLKEIFGGLKFLNVETFIASGNVVFEVKSGAAKALEARIAAKLEAELGYKVDTFLRTIQEVHEIASYRPFSAKAVEKSHSVFVGMLADPMTPAMVAEVLKFKTDVDDFHCRNREVYWLCDIPSLDSKFSQNKAFERIVQGPATFRNVNTMVRLAAKYPL